MQLFSSTGTQGYRRVYMRGGAKGRERRRVRVRICTRTNLDCCDEGWVSRGDKISHAAEIIGGRGRGGQVRDSGISNKLAAQWVWQLGTRNPDRHPFITCDWTDKARNSAVVAAARVICTGKEYRLVSHQFHFHFADSSGK